MRVLCVCTLPVPVPVCACGLRWKEWGRWKRTKHTGSTGRGRRILRSLVVEGRGREDGGLGGGELSKKLMTQSVQVGLLWMARSARRASVHAPVCVKLNPHCLSGYRLPLGRGQGSRGGRCGQPASGARTCWNLLSPCSRLVSASDEPPMCRILCVNRGGSPSCLHPVQAVVYRGTALGTELLIEIGVATL